MSENKGLVARIRAMFRKGKREGRKQKKGRCEMQDIAKLAEQIYRSGCGCYRYGARELFHQHAEGRSPEEIVRIYKMIDPKLHSYCGSTGSAYTYSNTRVDKIALDAVVKLLESAERGKREEVASDYCSISDKALFDGLREQNSIPIVKVAEKYAKDGDYCEALMLLHHVIVSDKEGVAKELASVMLKQYGPVAIKAILDDTQLALAERLRKAKIAARKIGDEAMYAKLGDAYAEAKQQEEGKQAAEKQLLGVIDDRISYEKQGEEKAVAKLRKEAEAEAGKLKEDAHKELKQYDQKISLLEKAAEHAPESVAAAMDAALAEAKMERGEAQQKLDYKLAAIDAKMQSGVVAVSGAAEEIVHKYESQKALIAQRAMVKEEYAALDGAMRKHQKDAYQA